jgi:hypothetical protein
MPEKFLINHQKADEFNLKKAEEFFKGGYRSRNASRSPTATFHDTKSSNWIENFTSLNKYDEEYKDSKTSQRKELGNSYLKCNIK